MKFEFNIKKSHIIVIIALLAIVGFGIAQTPQNPGHIASQVNIGGAVNNNLETWANSANGRISTIEGTYCQQGGLHCPASTLPQYIAYSVPDTVPCPAGTTGLICVKLGLPIAGFSQSNSYHPYWVSGQWRSSTSGSQGGCSRVICG